MRLVYYVLNNFFGNFWRVYGRKAVQAISPILATTPAIEYSMDKILHLMTSLSSLED